jgi:hypothetical protein
VVVFFDELDTLYADDPLSGQPQPWVRSLGNWAARVVPLCVYGRGRTVNAASRAGEDLRLGRPAARGYRGGLSGVWHTRAVQAPGSARAVGPRCRRADPLHRRVQRQSWLLLTSLDDQAHRALAQLIRVLPWC